MDSTRQPVAVVVGATSKWQADGRNTKLAHGRVIDDSDLPVGVRWGVGGAIAQKFAQEGFMVVLTTRQAANAAALEQAITRARRGRHDCRVGPGVAGLHRQGVHHRFATPWVTRTCWSTTPATWRGVICRPSKNCWNISPSTCSTPRMHIACRGPFLVAKEVLPAMRERGAGSFFFSNNSSVLPRS